MQRFTISVFQRHITKKMWLKHGMQGILSMHHWEHEDAIMSQGMSVRQRCDVENELSGLVVMFVL